MISVAVCDDEITVCDYLKKAVMDNFAKMDINGKVSVFEDGEPLVKRYIDGTADFDLILLDITMKHCDGLSAAKKIREFNKDVMIVFVSASAEYVFSGYEVRAFRYLLKPELTHGFQHVFKECIDQLSNINEIRFSFQTGANTVALPINDILYFESDRRVISIVTVNNKNYSFYSKLDTVEEQLKKKDFVRIHQSYLVNAKKITELNNGFLSMCNGTQLPISKHRSKETNEAFLWAMR